MLDYLISILNFTVDGVTYNLITTPWGYLIDWIETYKTYSNNSAYSTQLRDAYEMLAAIGINATFYVVALLILGTWLVYKLASGFTGWMRIR